MQTSEIGSDQRRPKRRRRLLKLGVPVLILGIGSFVGFNLLTSAQSAATCALVPGTGIAKIVTVGPDNTTIAVDGGQIVVNGAPCVGATTATTSQINYIGNSSPQNASIIDPTAFTRTTLGNGEIKFNVDGAGGEDSLTFDYTAAAAPNNSVIANAAGVNVNGDGDRDVTTPNVEGLTFVLGAGNDTLNGSAAVLPLIVSDGAGDDTASGGSGDDRFIGGAGNDNLDADGNKDTLDYSWASNGVTINPAEMSATGADIGTDTIADFTTYLTGIGNDTVHDDDTVCNFISTGPGNDRGVTGLIRSGSEEGGTCGDVWRLGEGGETGPEPGDWFDFSATEFTNPGSILDVVTGAFSGSPGESAGLPCEIENAVGGPGNDIIRATSGGQSCDEPHIFEGGDNVGTHRPDGSEGPELLIGANGNDILRGQGGNDSLIPYLGNDIADGGDGTDGVDYTALTANFTADLGAATITGGVTASIPNVENLLADGGSQTAIDNDNVPNLISLGVGDDRAVAGVTRSGSEPDGNGGFAGDTWRLGEGGEAEGDWFDFSATEFTNPGSILDVVTGAFSGSPGESAGLPCEIENARGGPGNDIIRATSGGVSCDEPHVFEGGDNVGTLRPDGSEGPELLIGANANDILLGQGGNDRLVPYLGNDTADGGNGNDDVDYTPLTADFTADLGAGTISGGATASIPNVENIFADGGSQTAIDNDNVPNFISLGAGDDTGVAGVTRSGSEPDGNGGIAGDTWRLGEGGETNGDWFDFSATEFTNPGSILDVVTGAFSGSPGESAGLPCEIENARGGHGVDVIRATSGGVSCDEPHEFHGGGNEGTVRPEGAEPGVDELLIGGNGPDKLFGEGGKDNVDGSGGDDVMDGGDGQDSVVIVTSGAPVTCNLQTGTVTGGQGADTATSFENCNGGSGNDTLIGNDGDNVLNGGDGDDRIEGGAGNDTIDGGIGNDTLYGGDGNDSMKGGDGKDFMDGGAGDDNMNGGNGVDTMYGGDGNDTIDGGNGKDEIHGGAGNDTLIGGGDNGSDSLFGDEGDDTLQAGLGSDFLDGGDGGEVNGDFGDAGGGPDTCTRLESEAGCEQHV
ncbi:MAG TPA: hypothetical protein VFA34_04120 [Actinomycetota bacterium]|jgi:Ca2+-binding RTX toxin-like protein|nr:hypothetical protein [Actinomycetota bacterium]